MFLTPVSIYPPDTPWSIALFRPGFCRGETHLVGGTRNWSHQPGEPLPAPFRNKISEQEYNDILRDIIQTFGSRIPYVHLCSMPCCFAGLLLSVWFWILAIFGMFGGVYSDHMFMRKSIIHLNAKWATILGRNGMRLVLQPSLEEGGDNVLVGRNGPWIDWVVWTRA